MKILVSAYTGLGNLIMKTPMLQAIKQNLPEATIDLISDSEFGTDALLKDSAFIDKVISLPKDSSRSEKQKVFDLLDHDLLIIGFDACPAFLHKMAMQSSIKKIIRHKNPSKSAIDVLKNVAKEKLWKKTEFIPLRPGRHETLLNIDLLAPLFSIETLSEIKTSISESKNNQVLERFQLDQQAYILIQTGAANGEDPTKTWPVDKWLSVIKWLLDNTEYKIVLCGDKGDRKNHILPIVQNIESDRVVDSSGKTSIEELISLIAHSKLLLCHDSGTMHIADALSKDLITLFGPSDASRTKPLRPTSRIIFSETEYLNYKYNFKSFSTSDLKDGQSAHYPMDAISEEDLINQINNIL